MRPRWIILGLLLASIAFGTVQQWPVRPMWMRPVEQNSRILGYCTERNSILILEFPQVQHIDLAFLVEKEVETGNELSRLKLPIEENYEFRGIQVLPGMKKLFVGYRYIDPTKKAEIDAYAPENWSPHFFRILDSSNGATLAGPFPFEGSSWVTFSPDGRWFWSYNPKTSYGHDVVETATGKTIVSFREQSDRRPIHMCCFSPASDAVAIHWYYKTGRHEIEVYDLPTGKKRFAHLLPVNVKFNWTLLHKWDRDRIFMQAEVLLAETRTYQQLFTSFQVLLDRLGDPQEEPQFSGYWDRAVQDRRQFTQEYGERLVQVTTMPSHEKPIFLQNVLIWFDKTLGTKWSDPVYGSMHLGFFDRVTGRPLYDFASSELRSVFMGGLTHDGQRLVGISDDGRRVTSTYPVKSLMEKQHPQFGLMMWDADPFPRWPWALAASVGTLLLILLFGRWRTKQVARSFGAISSPTA